MVVGTCNNYKPFGIGKSQGLLYVEGLADTHARNTIVLSLTRSYFERGVSALTGLGYQSFYIH